MFKSKHSWSRHDAIQYLWDLDQVIVAKPKKKDLMLLLQNLHGAAQFDAPWLEEILELFPHRCHTIQRLKIDRSRLVSKLGQLIELLLRTPSNSPLHVLHANTRDLISQMDALNSEELELITSSYWTDIGAVD